MRYRLMTQSPEKQACDALLLALSAPADPLARMVAGRTGPGDRAAVAGQLRYLAALIETGSPAAT